MRYLKTYKIFESYDCVFKDDINDILLSFSDAGFMVFPLDDINKNTGVSSLYITIRAPKVHRIDQDQHPTRRYREEDGITLTQDMIDDINRLFEFISNNGYDYWRTMLIHLFHTDEPWRRRSSDQKSLSSFPILELGEDFIKLRNSKNTILKPGDKIISITLEVEKHS